MADRPTATRTADAGVSVRKLEANDPAASPDGEEGAWLSLSPRGPVARPSPDVGGLVTALAHEIRNPLAAMTHSVSLLRSNLAPDSIERELADIVLAESARVNRIVRSVLGFARPSRGLAVVDLRQLLFQAVTLVSHDPELPEGVRVDLEATRDLPPIRIDADRVGQVVWNLLRNALQAVPPGGRIRVRLCAEELGGAPGLRVDVSDSGPGVPPQQRERAFEAFRTTRPGGTGLGLALARHVVELHNGWIGIGEAREGGARVSFWLPSRAGRG